jgi:capsular polysaccharide transport system permease protein
MRSDPDYLKSLHKSFTQQWRVMYALILRNIRTRFFGHGLGYLIAVAWPIVHSVVVISVFVISGRVAPFGESAILFVATGAIPFMIFSYLSRFMMLSTLSARPLLAFPEVKVLDILLSSALLEILTSLLVVIIMVIIAMIIDVDFWPREPLDAFFAICVSVLMGFGFGLFNGVIALAFPMWATIYVLFIIVFWVSSGVLFVTSTLPEPLRLAASYHPTLLIVEWMRSAYYDGYGNQILDRGYVLKFALVMVFGGFLLERGMRGYLSSNK